jgi:hypothetical protein
MCIFVNCICLVCFVLSYGYCYISCVFVVSYAYLLNLMCICYILCVFVVSYAYLLYLMLICCILRVFVLSYAYLLCLMCFCCTVCIAFLNLDAGLLARSQYPLGPATGHLDTGFSCFPCVYKRMLRWFPSLQVATTCLSCSPPDLNFLVTFFSYLCTCKITTATG